MFHIIIYRYLDLAHKPKDKSQQIISHVTLEFKGLYCALKSHTVPSVRLL